MISHEELKQINIASYNKHKDQRSKFGFIKCIDDSWTGFNSVLYNYKNNIIWCFVGTFGALDYLNDFSMYKGKITSQARKAQEIYVKLKDLYDNPIITGHSLGASTAQIIGAIFGNDTICFSPYGTALFNHGHHRNIINYGVETDAIFMRNIENQVGKTYIISSPDHNGSFIKNNKIDYKLLINKHLRISKGLKGHFLETYDLHTKVLFNESEYYKFLKESYIRSKPIL